jgi:hypothetical protein
MRDSARPAPGGAERGVVARQPASTSRSVPAPVAQHALLPTVPASTRTTEPASVRRPQRPRSRAGTRIPLRRVAARVSTCAGSRTSVALYHLGNQWPAGASQFQGSHTLLNLGSFGVLLFFIVMASSSRLAERTGSLRTLGVPAFRLFPAFWLVSLAWSSSRAPAIDLPSYIFKYPCWSPATSRWFHFIGGPFLIGPAGRCRSNVFLPDHGVLRDAAPSVGRCRTGRRRPRAGRVRPVAGDVAGDPARSADGHVGNPVRVAVVALASPPASRC